MDENMPQTSRSAFSSMHNPTTASMESPFNFSTTEPSFTQGFDSNFFPHMSEDFGAAVGFDMSGPITGMTPMSDGGWGQMIEGMAGWDGALNGNAQDYQNFQRNV